MSAEKGAFDQRTYELKMKLAGAYTAQLLNEGKSAEYIQGAVAGFVTCFNARQVVIDALKAELLESRDDVDRALKIHYRPGEGTGK